MRLGICDNRPRAGFATVPVGEHVERFEGLSELSPGPYFVRLAHPERALHSRLVVLAQ